ncbi:MAG: hypothetical protein IJY26_04440 [Clostridia bacterium]|nr:hypothetical protein [Clostridia bacterium]
MDFEVKNLNMLRAALDSFCEFLQGLDISEESIFDSRLVLSELASNVLKHSADTAFIKGGIVNGKIEVEVSSPARFAPPEKTSLPALDSEHGRGLYLVDKVGEKRFLTPTGGIRVVIHTVYKREEK